jgi:hypothetical protein
MAKKKRHSSVEIATKLAQADDLATQGKLKSEIAGRTRGEGDQKGRCDDKSSTVPHGLPPSLWVL